ncbi:hypothetical protein N7470_000334 [Penicillium chermesinum]|nr:hypothetical protein N7470_000334 [Penicillium chermesinum]
MTTIQTRRESWDFLSSTFGKLDVSFSQDSSYGSDEVSVSSTTTAPLPSSVSTVSAPDTPSLQPFLKSILKKPTFDSLEDIEYESGYESDHIELEYDSLSEDNDNPENRDGDQSESESEDDAEDEDDEDEDDEDDEDDDDLDCASADFSDFSVWDEDTNVEVPESRNDHTESFDDTFIGFGASVHFHPKIEYFDRAPMDESEEPDGQMTAHEMMLLAMKSGDSQSSWPQPDGDVSDDECETDHKEFVDDVHIRLEDFTDETVEDDRRQFIAYIIAIHGDSTKYEPYLSAQANNIRLGRKAESPDDGPPMYLDTVSNHVIGLFRHLLPADELNALIAARKDQRSQHIQSKSSEAGTHELTHSRLLNQIECLLLDRLTNGQVEITPNELSFFASGVLHALGTNDLPPLA